MGRALKEIVGENIRRIRKLKRLSQAHLAEKFGLSTRYISKVENDTPDITLHNLQALSEGLGVRVADLVGVADARRSVFSKKDRDSIERTIEILGSLE